MSDIRTRLDQIQAEQKRQGEVLDNILEALYQPLEAKEVDALMAKGLAMVEQRRVTAAIAQPPKQREQ